MSADLLAFRRREYLSIETGIVRQQPYPFDRNGTRVFWLVYHQEDGGEFEAWMGESHADALNDARLWELPVVDRTGLTGNVTSAAAVRDSLPPMGGDAA